MSDIIVGSVGVRLVPSGEGFAAKAKALTRGLAADVRIGVDDKEAQARLDELGRPRSVTLNANADTTAASAQLDAAARNRNVRFEASGLSAMVTGALTLGPALVPIVAAAAGLTAALGAPLVAAGGGATLYALIAGKAVKDTETQSKAIDQLQKKVDAAKQSLATASTAAGKKSALATLATDTKAYNDALKSLSPAQAGFIKAQSNLKGAFTDLERSAGPAIFGPLTSGMQALATLLPKVAPVLKPVSAAISGLLDEVARSAKSGAVNDFLNFLAAMSGPTITGAGHVLGNIAVGFGAIGSAFMPISRSVGDALLNWSQGFSKIGSSKGLADFVGYVQKVGPQVASTLGEIVRAIVHLASALAPIGGAGLTALRGVAKVINAMPTSVLGTLAAGLVTAAVGMKALSIATAVAGGVRALAAAFGALDIAMEANPVGIVVVALASLAAGLVYAYKNSQTFRNVVTGALHGVAAAGKFLWNSALQPALHFIVDALGHVEVAAGKMLQAFGHVPGFGWAKTAGNLMVAAGHAAEGLASSIHKIPTHSSTLYGFVGQDRALSQIAQIKAQLASIPPVKRTSYFVTQVNSVAKAGINLDPTHGKHATGGLINGPGTGTSDSIPALLSNGEFVVNAAATARNRALLESINAQRYAGGGYVARATASSTSGISGPVRLVVDGYEFSAYLEAVADDRIGAHNGIAAQTRRAR